MSEKTAPEGTEAENKEQSTFTASDDSGQTKTIDVKAAIEEPAPQEQPEEASGGKNDEQEYSAAEGTDAGLLSEFAPKPISIPNVNLEKEKKKQEKRKQNRGKEAKKVEARKNRGKKKRSAAHRAAAAAASVLLFVLLTAAMTGFIGILSVQTATSDYAFRLAVRNMDIAEITIGGISDYESLGMERCSRKAALVDIIRDNSNVEITYREIISAVESSGVERFLSGRLKEACDYVLTGKPYTPVTGSEIANVIRDNATVVRNLTGRILGEEDYSNIAAHFEAYGNMNEISKQAIDSTSISKYTPYLRRLMSMKILGAALLICICLIILLCAIGRGYAHIPLGWSFILSGIAVMIGAIFFRPSYGVSSPFLNTVLKNYFSFFTITVVVIAGIFAVIGAFIFLVGNTSSDHDD